MPSQTRMPLQPSPSPAQDMNQGGQGTPQAAGSGRRGNSYAQDRLNAKMAFRGSVDGGRAGTLPYRAEMEQAFGCDFSGVCAVFGSGRGSGDLPADAATDGDTIFFTDANPTREQVAHELTHVVQQGGDSGSGSGGSGASRPGDASEREAANQGRVVAAGGQASVQQDGGAAIHGDWWDNVSTWLETEGHDVAQGLGLESDFDANLGRAEAFRSHGDYGPQDMAPKTGKGGFEGVYHPSFDAFQIALRCAVQFVDGLTVDSSGTVTPGNANLQAAATAAGGMTEPERSAFIAQYQWVGAEKGTWMSDLETSVQGAWSQQYEFFINRPQWEWMGATVDVDVQTAERTRTPADHLALDTVKVPTGTKLGEASVSPGTSSSATDQTGIIGSTAIAPRVDNMLQGGTSRSVSFANDSDVLDAAQMATLDTWIATYQGAPGNAASHPTQLTLQAHTSSTGSDAHNLDLAQRRAQAVSQYLTSHGFTDVPTRATVDNKGETGANPSDNAGDRRVDLIVDNGQDQVVANHEFGHAFGLGDEYATGAGSMISGTGAAAGTAAAHDTQAKAMTDASGVNLPGAIHENNGNIMSLGNAVQPQHYSTFHEALCTLTGVSEWALGPKQAKPVAPGTLGDFPSPSPDGPVIV